MPDTISRIQVFLFYKILIFNVLNKQSTLIE